ncbi:MAG: glycoside hydrolase family 3 C-terminal domain-containing protein [Bacteroidia bacterium]|nr:glycoside hydrolase family 3 C-terminal domain-containing protein [Bacteroidia bacterium]
MTNNLLLKSLFLACIILCIPCIVSAQFYRYNNAEIEGKIDTLLSRMKTEDKIALLSGYKNGKIRGIPDISLQDIKTGSFYFYNSQDEFVNDYPASLTLAAAWDTTLAFQLGKQTAQAARNHGYGALTGPDLNLYRNVLDTENPVHFSEDGFLSGLMGSAVIKGVQSQNVLSFPTGFVADYAFFTQRNISFTAEDRSIEETYLVPYRMAVDKGKAAGIVLGENTIGNEKLKQSELYITDILKGECLFEGIAIASSEEAQFSGRVASRAGIDLELPFTRAFHPDTLKTLLSAGTLTPGLLDDKVRRILRMLYHYNLIQDKNLTSQSPVAMRNRDLLNLSIARNSITLLKNQGILPLSPEKSKSIAIIGPYGKSQPLWDSENHSGKKISGETTFAEAMILQKEANTKIYIEKGVKTPDEMLIGNEYYTTSGFLTSGLQSDYFDGIELDKNPILSEIALTGKIKLSDKHSGLNTHDGIAARWTGVMENAEADAFLWFCSGSDGWRVYIDDSLVIDEWKESPFRTLNRAIQWDKAGVHTLKVEHFSRNTGEEIRFGYTTGFRKDIEAATNAAAKSEVAILCLGYDAITEKNGREFELPFLQQELLKSVLKANPQAILVLQGGGTTNLTPWIDSLKALFHIYYPMAHTGEALAEVIMGRFNPSGRLPISLERNPQDNPSFSSLYDTDHDGKVFLSEGWKMGYKNYTTVEDAPQPLFPFGFGLSYTDFVYTNLTVEPNNYTGTGNLTIRFDVINVGKMEGSDVPQVYLKDVQSAKPRPLRELKAFMKLTLKPGESRSVSLTISPEELAYYHPEKRQWVTENGVFEIQLGKNATDIQLKAPFVYSGEKIYKKRRRR